MWHWMAKRYVGPKDISLSIKRRCIRSVCTRTQTGIVLQEQIVGDKENELSRIQEFLTPQCIKGRIISADALHTQQAFCLGVRRAEGDYVLFAKGNQPTLHEDLHLFFREPPLDCRDWRTAHTCNTGHGRLEMRDLIASTELNDFLGRALDWDCPGMRAFVAGCASPWSVPRRWCMASRV